MNLQAFESRYMVSEGGCWVMKTSLRAGYGRVRLAGKTVAAHRWRYEAEFGPVPSGLVLDHRVCDREWRRAYRQRTRS